MLNANPTVNTWQRPRINPKLDKMLVLPFAAFEDIARDYCTSFVELGSRF
jgi:hypothetical protein